MKNFNSYKNLYTSDPLPYLGITHTYMGSMFFEISLNVSFSLAVTNRTQT